MKMNILRPLLVVMMICFIVGLALVFTAPMRGIESGSRNLFRITGSHEQFIERATKSYQIGGSVLSVFGGIGIFVSGYFLFKEIAIAKAENDSKHDLGG